MKLKEDIVTSESAKRMMSYILPFYNNDEYMLHVFQAMGVEFDRLFEILNTFEDQLFPQRATWSVFYWEQLFGLPVGVGEPYEERRKRLLAFLGSGQPINKSRVESLLKTTADVGVKIEENISPYTFRILLENSTDGDYIALQKLINDIKPAHLSYTISPRTAEKMKFKEKVYVNLRRYHTVREFRVGKPAMMEQNEVAL